MAGSSSLKAFLSLEPSTVSGRFGVINKHLLGERKGHWKLMTHWVVELDNFQIFPAISSLLCALLRGLPP